MSIASILAGLVFLFNPHINIIDILPDAIGYGLILYGILRLSHINAAMTEAASRFKILLIVSLCKLPCLYVYSIVTPEEQIWILLLSLAFGITEAVLGFLAFGSLFTSLDGLCDQTRDSHVTAKLPTVRLMTSIFVIVKPVMAILPDLTLLIDDRYGVVTAFDRSLKSFRGLFNVFSFVLTLIFGIIWLVTVLGYFRGIRKDSAFLDEIAEKIAAYEKEDRRGKFRYLITTLGFLLYAFLFCLELKIEGYSILPPFVNAALFGIATYLLYRFYRGGEKKPLAKTAFISSIVYFVTATVGYILSVRFTDAYYHEDVGDGFANQMQVWLPRNFEASTDILVINIVVALSQIAFAVMAVMLYRLFFDIVETYGGNPESILDERDRTPEMREREAYADKTVKAALHKGKKLFLAVSLLTAISSALFPMLEIYFNEFFMIDLVIRTLFVILTSTYIVRLKNGVKVKAGLDFD